MRGIERGTGREREKEAVIEAEKIEAGVEAERLDKQVERHRDREKKVGRLKRGEVVR